MMGAKVPCAASAPGKVRVWLAPRCISVAAGTPKRPPLQALLMNIVFVPHFTVLI